VTLFATAYVVMPGGLGTLTSCEALTRARGRRARCHHPSTSRSGGLLDWFRERW
jgi:predicted Rossmann-fold nucleotide-binding protein